VAGFTSEPAPALFTHYYAIASMEVPCLFNFPTRWLDAN
jgi:hypothetical protein